MRAIDIVVRASALHDEKEVEALTRKWLGGIQEAGGLELVQVKTPRPDRPTAVLVLTGGVEREVLKVLAKLPSPSLLIAHSGHNSLPAALEILARIRQEGGEGRILFGSAEEIAAGLTQELTLVGAWESLRFSRIGIIGSPSDWLVASDVDRAFLKGRLAIEPVDIEIDELIQRIEASAERKADIKQFEKDAREVREAKSGDVRDAVGIYGGLRSLVDDYRLSACTVRCFDLLERVHTTGCYALSRLNDEQIPAGCEGDLQTLFSLYIAYLLAGKAGFMGNIASVDLATRTIGIAHCTCPLTMTASYAIRSHFESGLGVGIQGALPEGPCTVFRLGGERLDQLFIREGRMLSGVLREDLCRTQVEVVTDEPVDVLLTEPLGNHHVLLAGHHRDTVERFFSRYLST